MLSITAKRRRLTGFFLTISLLATASATQARAEETVSITVPQGQTSFSYDLYLDESEAFAGAEFGLTLSDETALNFTSFTLGDDVKGAARVPITNKNDAYYFGFYTASNNYSGRIHAGTLQFAYAGGDQTIVLTEAQVVRIDEDGNAIGDKKPSPLVSIKVSGGGSGSNNSGSGGSGSGGSGSGGSGGSGSGGSGSGDSIGSGSGGSSSSGSGSGGSGSGDSGSGGSNGVIPDGASSDSAGLQSSISNTTVKSKYFDDVDEKLSWAVNEIDSLYEAGVVKGTAPRLFSPNANITRADFTVMLVRAFKLTAETDGNFQDIPKDSYYYESVAIAKALGIAKGEGNNNFNPGAQITRQDIMALTDRVTKTIGKPLPAGAELDLSSFPDQGLISDYARPSVATLVKTGIVKGDGYGVNPLGKATRAEAAGILHRLLSLE
ncbi:MAG: S-layer homology domain-containing protein [Clostridiales bacterium]|nr:S-layer homology domain-containing protein [Clostridiales bacterium]